MCGRCRNRTLEKALPGVELAESRPFGGPQMKTRFAILVPLLIAVPVFVFGAIGVVGWLRWPGHAEASTDIDGHAESSTDITLKLVCEKPVIKVGKTPKIAVSIFNKGETKVLLVEPGCSSTVGWRTPTVEWSHVVEMSGGRCGNINRLTAKEIFILQPGETRSLSAWIGAPQFNKPGRYQVSVRYINNPNQKWQGLPLGEHDAWAMRQVGRSTKVSAVSNTVEIIVQE